MPLTLNGTTGVQGNSGAFVAGTAVSSISVTNIDFTTIPNWVKRITVMFSDVSTNGSSSPQIQIGSGSVDTTGYTSFGMSITASNVGASASSGFVIRSGSASATLSGHLVLTLLSNNLWVVSSVISDTTNGALSVVNGTKTLSGVLDRVRITTVNGTDTFDAGSVNILYE